MNLPFVSIIVPIFKVEKYIVQCARSIFEQDYTNLDIIFIDDCSPDISISLLLAELEKYPNRKQQTRILHNKKNIGLAATRTKGFRYATGEYLWTIDSDDWVEPNSCSQLIKCAIENQVDIVFFDFIYDTPKSSQVESMNAPTDVDDFLISILRSTKNGNLANKLIKRSLISNKEVIIPDEITIGEDFSRTVLLLQYYKPKLYYLPIPLYHYRLNTESMTHQLDSSFYKKEILFCGFIMTLLKTEREKWAFAEFQSRLILQIVAAQKLEIYELHSLFNAIRNYRWYIHIPLEYKLALYCLDYGLCILARCFIKFYFLRIGTENLFRKKAFEHKITHVE